MSFTKLCTIEYRPFRCVRKRHCACLALMLVLLMLISMASSAPYPARGASGIALFVPAVAFPSLQGTISSDQLRAIRNGQLDPNLILDPPTADALRSFGVPLAVQTRLVAADVLQTTLWQYRSLYTLLSFDRLTVRDRMLRIDEQLPFDTDLSTYAFAFASATPTYQPEKLTRVVMSGTTAIARLTADAIDQHGVMWAGDGIRDYTRHADFFHISNEVAFDPTCIRSPKLQQIPFDLFCTKDSVFPLLPYLGVNIVELSGNHNLDYGTAPYLHTLDLYRAEHIATIAGGETLAQARQPLPLTHHDNRITLLSCNWVGPAYALVTADHPGAAYCDRNWLRSVIPQLAKQSDVLIVSVQYKELTSFRPLDQQRIDFRELADLGASVVIGTQAHTPQTFEFYPVTRGGQAFIHYGLGNLYFDQTNFQQRFFMDQLFVYDGRLLTVDLFTGYIEQYAHPRAMTDDERRYFLRVLFEASDFSWR